MSYAQRPDFFQLEGCLLSNDLPHFFPWLVVNGSAGDFHDGLPSS